MNKTVQMMDLSFSNNPLPVASRVITRLEVLGEKDLYKLYSIAQSCALKYGDYATLEELLHFIPKSSFARLFAKDCRTARRFSIKTKKK